MYIMSNDLIKNPLEGIEDYYLEAARGNIPESFILHKFGDAANVDVADVPATIWDGSCDELAGPKISQYTYSTSADITDIASSDNGDTATIEVQGLDTNWELTFQTVVLTGQTPVILSTPLLRVFRMINRGTTEVVGTVYLTTSGAARTLGVPDVGSTVRAIIKDGDNQTQMSLFTVPEGYSMYIRHAWSSLSRFGPSSAAGAQIRIKRRSFEGVFRVVHTLYLGTNGSSSDHRPYDIPIKFNAKEDIEYSVQEVSSDNMGISSGFHAVLIKE